MTKIDIISGFLGAGKTTLIKKLLKEAMAGTRVVLIENEFGEIGVDGGFLQEAGIQIKEMNSGCICCSLVGDFGASLKEVLAAYQPERILIEPSGVGKLSDVMKAVREVSAGEEIGLNSAVTVVDASKCRMYIKNFGEFFINQIENARVVILSRTGSISQEKLNKCVEMIREHNAQAAIITTPWDELDGKDILKTIEGADSLADELLKEVKREHEHHHEHHHHEHHGHECSCGHDHGHEGNHQADEVFTSWGMETPAIYGERELESILEKLEQEEKYGLVLRAKGMVSAGEGTWLYFDYVPGEGSVRKGAPCVTGRLCVIGSALKEENLTQLFER